MSYGPQLPPDLEQEPRTSGPSLPTDTADIGPSIPDDRADIGPSLPPVASPSRPPAGPSLPPAADADDADAYGPALPPDLLPSKPKRAPAGPARPLAAYAPSPPPDEEEAVDDFGPMPLPEGVTVAEPNLGVLEFREREERRRKEAEEVSKPKKLEREEWMTALPEDAGILGALKDPTKLRSRAFSRQTTTSTKSDSSLWTETPAEKQQRLTDEVSGKRKRATATDGPEVDHVALARDAEIRREVERHAERRGGSLVDQHTSKKAKKTDDDGGAPVIWDRDSMMNVKVKQHDDASRQRMIQDAKSLGDRFGRGKFA